MTFNQRHAVRPSGFFEINEQFCNLFLKTDPSGNLGLTFQSQVPVPIAR
jgi:hypothetical protein